MATLGEIEARRAERRAENDKARTAQEALDLEAIDALESERGEPLHTMTANGYRSGVSVKVAFRAPSAPEYKRYCDLVGKAQERKDPTARRQAQEQLAASCWLYPAQDSDGRKAMLEAFPGVLISLAIEVAKVAELRAEDEGKG
jgi:hypothetical protein